MVPATQLTIPKGAEALKGYVCLYYSNSDALADSGTNSDPKRRRSDIMTYFKTWTNDDAQGNVTFKDAIPVVYEPNYTPKERRIVSALLKREEEWMQLYERFSNVQDLTYMDLPRMTNVFVNSESFKVAWQQSYEDQFEHNDLKRSLPTCGGCSLQKCAAELAFCIVSNSQQNQLGASPQHAANKQSHELYGQTIVTNKLAGKSLWSLDDIEFALKHVETQREQFQKFLDIRFECMQKENELKERNAELSNATLDENHLQCLSPSERVVLPTSSKLSTCPFQVVDKSHRKLPQFIKLCKQALALHQSFDVVLKQHGDM